MKEGDYLVMLEERRLRWSRLREIADEGSCGIAAGAVGVVEAGLKREVCCVSVLAWAWMKIEVKVANESSTFSLIIPNAKDLDILMPRDIIAISGFYNNLATDSKGMNRN